MATPVGRPPASAATIRAVLLVGLGWLLLAIALGAGGVMRMLAPAAAPVVLMGLTAIVLTTAVRRGAVREWLWRLDERCLVAIHLTRFVGAYFLFLYMRGQLPYAFAVPGGWGDIAVATLAAALLAAGPPRNVRRRRLYMAWNVFGLVDILFVVATAARLLRANPASMAALRDLPLSLLPTFLVPLLIASHVVLALRLAHDARRS